MASSLARPCDTHGCRTDTEPSERRGVGPPGGSRVRPSGEALHLGGGVDELVVGSGDRREMNRRHPAST